MKFLKLGGELVNLNNVATMRANKEGDTFVQFAVPEVANNTQEGGTVLGEFVCCIYKVPFAKVLMVLQARNEVLNVAHE